MNDTDIELERRLRTHFRDLRAEELAPSALRTDILAIPRLAGGSTTHGWLRRRGLTLLAATVALGVGAAGWAILVGGRSPEQPRPTQPALLLAPSPSASPVATPLQPSPAPTNEPVTAVPSQATDGTGPGIPDGTGQAIAAGWKAAGTMSEARILPTATLLQDGRVLVVGGLDSNSKAIASAELWDPTTRTFSPAGSMARPRIGHAATLLQDGRVLVVGGEDAVEGLPLQETEVWDPATGRFEVAGTMPALPSGLSATTLHDGRVLIVRSDACVVARVLDKSGRMRCPEGATGATWLWNPDGTYVAGPALNESRLWHTATLLPDGRVLLAGNNGWSLDSPESAEVFDPATNRFIRVDEPRDYISGGQSATLLPDGRVLIAGGDTSEPNGGDPHYMGPLRTAETWDPVSGTFHRAGRMDLARRAHQAALLPDGHVMIVGGTRAYLDGVDPSTATTEIWDPATGSFIAGPDMADARARFTLTTLPDGSLLAIGGDAHYDAQHDNGTALASAEILDFSPSN